MQQSERIIRKKELFKIIPVSDACVWRWEREGQFPKRIQLGGNSVGWLQSEINQWLETKAAER